MVAASTDTALVNRAALWFTFGIADFVRACISSGVVSEHLRPSSSPSRFRSPKRRFYMHGDDASDSPTNPPSSRARPSRWASTKYRNAKYKTCRISFSFLHCMSQLNLNCSVPTSYCGLFSIPFYPVGAYVK